MTNQLKSLGARINHFFGWVFLTDAYLETLNDEQLRRCAGLRLGKPSGARFALSIVVFSCFGLLSAKLGADIAHLCGLAPAFAWCLITVVAIVGGMSAAFSRILPDELHAGDVWEPSPRD